ncbi:PREDICTED: ninja-family protein AFP1-like isoform X2 [Lupinus angustifolius]|nr:PREDICTED: ninja-family protein AFP1-like isoform X2 [Lupinus angustifolius]
MIHNHKQHHHNPVYVKMEKEKEKYPRDLLQRFNMSSSGGSGSDNHHQHQNQFFNHNQQEHGEEHGEEDKEEGIELNLGLSLGGKFGVDKYGAYKSNKLTRSSSVVGTMPLFREDEAAASPSSVMAAPRAAIMRTSSLPVETEDEWRKRKELQTLRRMEAKRRRSEKRGSKSERESSATAGGGGLEEVEGASAAAGIMGLNRFGGGSSKVGPPFWGMGAKQVVLGDVLGKGKVDGAGFQGLFAQPSSQGSIGSQGGSSISVSEMESKPFLGTSNCGKASSPASNQSLQERSGKDAIGSSRTKTNENITRASRAAEMENPYKRSPHAAQNMGREIGTNSMGDMPCVFTKGDGPNGKRIEGILYKYGKGEEVRIMCVCHGNFLSPAEFVKHAGGGDVANPLRHIVINPSAAPFL